MKVKVREDQDRISIGVKKVLKIIQFIGKERERNIIVGVDNNHGRVGI